MPFDSLIRWAARGIGTAWALLFLAFFFGEGVFGSSGWLHEGFRDMGAIDVARQAALLLNSIGLLAIWWRERMGAVLALAGIVAFLAVYPPGFPLWAVMGALIPPLLIALRLGLAHSR